MSTSPSNAATPKRSPSVKRISSSAVNNNGGDGRCPPKTTHLENPEIEADTAALALSSSPRMLSSCSSTMIAESSVQSITAAAAAAGAASSVSRRATTITTTAASAVSPTSTNSTTTTTTTGMAEDRKLRKSKLSSSFRLNSRSPSSSSSISRSNNHPNPNLNPNAAAASMEAESGGDSSSSSIPGRFFELLKRPFVHRKKFQQQRQQQQQQQQQQQRTASTVSTISSTTASSSTSTSSTNAITAGGGRGVEKTGLLLLNNSSSSKKDVTKLRIRVALENATLDNQSSSEDLEEPEVVQADGQLFRSRSLPQLLKQPVLSPPSGSGTSSNGAGAAVSAGNSHERAVRVNFIPADRGLHNSRYSGKDGSPQGDRPNVAAGKKSPARPRAATPTDSSPRKSSRRLPALTIDSIISSGLDSSKGDMEDATSAMQRARQQWILQHVVNTADDARSATNVVQEEEQLTSQPKRRSTSLQVESQITQEAEISTRSNRKSVSRESISSTADGTQSSAMGSASFKKRLSVERRKSIEKRMSIERKRKSLEFFFKDIGEDRPIEESPAAEVQDSCIPLRKRHSCSVPHLKRHTSEPKLNSTSISGATCDRSVRNGRRTASSRNLIRAGKFKTNEFFGFNPDNRKRENSVIMPDQIGMLQDSIRLLEQQTLSPAKILDPGTPDNIVAPKLPIPQLRQHATSIDTQLTSPRLQSKITDENLTPSIGIISHQHNDLTDSMQALSSILHCPIEEPADRSTRLNAPQLLGLQPRHSPTSSSGSDTQNMARRRWQWNQRSSPCEATSPTAAEITQSPSFSLPSPNSQPQTNFVLKPFQHLVGCPGASESGNESDTLCVFQTPPSHSFKPLHTAQSEVLEMQVNVE